MFFNRAKIISKFSSHLSKQVTRKSKNFKIPVESVFECIQSIIVPGETSEGRDVHYKDHLALVLGQADVPGLQDIWSSEIVDVSFRETRTETGATADPRGDRRCPQQDGECQQRTCNLLPPHDKSRRARKTSRKYFCSNFIQQQFKSHGRVTRN